MNNIALKMKAMKWPTTQLEDLAREAVEEIDRLQADVEAALTRATMADKNADQSVIEGIAALRARDRAHHLLKRVERERDIYRAAVKSCMLSIESLRWS